MNEALVAKRKWKERMRATLDWESVVTKYPENPDAGLYPEGMIAFRPKRLEDIPREFFER